MLEFTFKIDHKACRCAQRRAHGIVGIDGRGKRQQQYYKYGVERHFRGLFFFLKTRRGHYEYTI
jgi:hypothetical protein